MKEHFIHITTECRPLWWSVGGTMDQKYFSSMVVQTKTILNLYSKSKHDFIFTEPTLWVERYVYPARFNRLFVYRFLVGYESVIYNSSLLCRRIKQFYLMFNCFVIKYPGGESESYCLIKKEESFLLLSVISNSRFN